MLRCGQRQGGVCSLRDYTCTQRRHMHARLGAARGRTSVRKFVQSCLGGARDRGGDAGPRPDGGQACMYLSLMCFPPRPRHSLVAAGFHSAPLPQPGRRCSLQVVPDQGPRIVVCCKVREGEGEQSARGAGRHKHTRSVDRPTWARCPEGEGAAAPWHPLAAEPRCSAHEGKHRPQHLRESTANPHTCSQQRTCAFFAISATAVTNATLSF